MGKYKPAIFKSLENTIIPNGSSWAVRFRHWEQKQPYVHIQDMWQMGLNNTIMKAKNKAISQFERMAKELELKRLRSAVLADAQYLGIYTPGDWTAFNRFMLHKSVYKKDLTLYKIEEFPELIKQFKSMRSNFERSKKNAGTKAWFQQYGGEPSKN